MTSKLLKDYIINMKEVVKKRKRRDMVLTEAKVTVSRLAHICHSNIRPLIRPTQSLVMALHWATTKGKAKVLDIRGQKRCLA